MRARPLRRLLVLKGLSLSRPTRISLFPLNAILSTALRPHRYGSAASPLDAHYTLRKPRPSKCKPWRLLC